MTASLHIHSLSLGDLPHSQCMVTAIKQHWYFLNALNTLNVYYYMDMHPFVPRANLSHNVLILLFYQ